MDIRKAIEKLNSIDAKDLKNIDLSKFKEYNFERLKEELSTRPKLLINMICIVLAVVSMLYNVSFYKIESSRVQSEIETLMQKLDVNEASKTAQANYKKFMDEIPESIPNNRLVGKISDYAEKAKVNIISFSPLTTRESEYLNQYIVNLNIRAETYQDLVNFISSIENSEYILKVNKFSVRSNKERSGNYRGEPEIPLDVTIEISSIKLNNV